MHEFTGVWNYLRSYIYKQKNCKYEMKGEFLLSSYIFVVKNTQWQLSIFKFVLVWLKIIPELTFEKGARRFTF